MRRLPLLRSLAFAFALVATMVGCSSTERPLTVGVKNFGEQKVLGEVLRLAIANAQGARDENAVAIEHCGDTFSCHAAFRAGEVDVLVEYSGTAALYAGIDPNAADSQAQLKDVWARAGGEIVGALGFNNGYRVAVSQARAAALELANLSDIDTKMGAVTFAAPKTYLQRPGDGLGALLSRYGIRRKGAPVVIDEPLARINALLDGRADIAILYETDGALAQAPVRLLEDDDVFFPRYDALILARTKAMEANPRVHNTLKELVGAVSAKAMRQMNAQVALKGQSPRAAAAAFWSQWRGANEEDIPAPQKGERPAVKIATRKNAATKQERLVATQAVRAAFAPRPVELFETDDVEKALAKGRAQVALLEAADLFTTNRKGEIVRKRKVAAAAVVGSRVLHALVRQGDRGKKAPFGKTGVLARSRLGSGAVLALLSASQRKADATFDDVSAALAALDAGTIDCALLMLPLNDAQVANAMREGRVALGDVERFALLRPVPATPRARLPAGTYPNQGGSRAAYRTQVLLASTTPDALDAALLGGPAAALATSARPLTAEEIEILAAKTGAYEAPDPALPSARKSTLKRRPAKAADDKRTLTDTLLNLFTIAFLFFTAFLLFKKEDEA